ncbi:MAG: DHH family phosphoesterase [Lachnospiraceae bacterium]|nr:DHH family phosphoesterase [Lachnospiraceae bacterium]
MNPLKLVELLKGHKVFIQTHNFPDPDAIASSFGLQYFLKVHGVESDICYDGRIDKLSTKKMFGIFGIVARSIEAIDDMKKDDYIVVVDAQKLNANLTDFIGDEVACIDHHPTFKECEYQYKDVRIVGACSSIIGDYFRQTDTEIPANVAAALAYGIKMDTADFTRGAYPFDAEVFSYLFEKADTHLINDMYMNVMELPDLKAYGAAIDSIQLRGEVGFAKIPFDCPDALIAIISDFILSLDVVTVSVVYSVRTDGIKFSVRSEVDSVDAGKLAAISLDGIGNGGGHKGMAGGFIHKNNFPALGEDLDENIRKRFMMNIEL